MNRSLILTCFILVILCTSSVVCNTVSTAAIPAKYVYPSEGSSFKAKCVGTGSTAPPNDLVIGRGDNSEIKEGDVDGGRLKITKTTEGNKVTLTLTLDPVKLSDTFLKTMSCVSGLASHGYNIVIIPKNSVPIITLQPNETKGSKGDTKSFECKVTTQLVNPVVAVLIKWKFEKLDNALDNAALLKNDRYKITKGVDLPTNKSSTLTINSLELKDVGAYYCFGELQLTSLNTEENYYQTANITSVTWNGAAGDGKTEVESKAGGEAKMTCSMSGYPIPTISWKKGDATINNDTDTRFAFTNSSSGDSYFPNNVFMLKDVTYSDRAVYSCVAEYKEAGAAKPSKVVTQQFRLRVRDPLGALWPAIGIIVEAVVLFIIIGLYELCTKKKTKGAGSTTDQVDHASVGKSEKSPLVQGEKHVSYHSGDDGVRARINTGAVDA